MGPFVFASFAGGKYRALLPMNNGWMLILYIYNVDAPGLLARESFIRGYSVEPLLWRSAFTTTFSVRSTISIQGLPSIINYNCNTLLEL